MITGTEIGRLYTRAARIALEAPPCSTCGAAQIPTWLEACDAGARSDCRFRLVHLQCSAGCVADPPSAC